MAVIASSQITLSRQPDIDQTIHYYKKQSSTSAAPAKPTSYPPTGWTTTEPSYSSGDTDTLYTTVCTLYSDGTFDYADVSVSSSYEAAKAAYNKAVSAENVANSKNAVFYQASAPGTSGRKVNDIWFDSDDGNAMYKFDGTDWVLQQFGTNALVASSVTAAKINTSDLYTNFLLTNFLSAAQAKVSSLSAITANIGTITAGILKSSDYSYSSGTYTTAGMIIDLNNKVIRSKYAAILGDGKLYASAGTIGPWTIDTDGIRYNTLENSKHALLFKDGIDFRDGGSYCYMWGFTDEAFHAYFGSTVTDEHVLINFSTGNVPNSQTSISSGIISLDKNVNSQTTLPIITEAIEQYGTSSTYYGEIILYKINGTTLTTGIQLRASDGYILASGTVDAKKLHVSTGADAAVLENVVGNTIYNLIRNHNNGNISVSASGSGLYLGYENTTSINFLNGKATMESTGNFSTINGSGAAWIRACRSTTGNRIFIQANTDGTVELGSAGANNTQYGILKRADNSNNINAYGNWFHDTSIYVGANKTTAYSGVGAWIGNNGNLTLVADSTSGAGGGIYFGYKGTNTYSAGFRLNSAQTLEVVSGSLLVNGSNIALHKDGYINVTRSGGSAWVQARNADGGNSIYIQAETAGTVTFGSRCANGTHYTILQRANNSSWITAMNNWSFSNYPYFESGIVIRNTGLTKGTNPSAETNRLIIFTDKEGYSSTQADVISMIYGGGVTAAGTAYTILRTFQFTTANSNYAQLLVGYSTYPYITTNCAFEAVGGDVLSTVSSGEAHVYARNSASGNRIFIYANSSSGTAGLYTYDASNTARAILIRANNSHAITAYGNWTFNGTLICNNYAGNASIPVVSSTEDGKRAAVIEATSSTAMRIRGQWGTTGTTYAYRTATVSSSDIRLKKNIKDCTVSALPIIDSIRVREFDWVDGKHQTIGMIADELEKIDGRMAVGGGYDAGGSMDVKSVDTFYLIGYLVKAVQELSTELKQLKGAA